MSFHNAATPEDLPPSHQGDDWPEEIAEREDTALTEWLGGRQPNLQPEEALLGVPQED